MLRKNVGALRRPVFSVLFSFLFLVFSQASSAQGSDIVYCDVDYDITNDWGQGFQVNVTITNETPMPIEGYELV